MIWLLPVTWDDSADLLRWRNDPVTRANIRETEEVSPEDHQAWMRDWVAAKDTVGWAWVADVDGTSVGTIRVSNNYEVSITVAPEHRGKGYSKQMLKQVCDQFNGCWLTAEIKATNAASRYIFEVNGFKMTGCDGEYMQYRRIPE